MKALARALVILSLVALVAPSASAEEVWILKKQEEKKKSRWSLQDWLETRDRMMLMDLWLAVNSASPFEFYLAGDYQALSENTLSTGSDGWRLQLGAFATIFGLEVTREETGAGSQTQGLFRLRFFGVHDQGTNLTFDLGMRSREFPEGTIRSGVVGGSMTIYLARYFGVKLDYRRHLQSIPSSSGLQAIGGQFEGGAFIDFSFLRIFGSYLSQSETTTYAGTSRSADRSGMTFGVRLYF